MFGRIFGFAALAAATTAMAANAQSGRDPYVPAELPPSSFTGVQYVDSTGCAFIRAGFGGQLNWVPRFDKDRNPICGLVPTVQMAGAPDERVAPVPDEAPATTAAADPVPAPAPAAPARQPTPRAAAAPAPALEAPAPAPAKAAPLHVAEGAVDHCPNYDPVGREQSRTGATPVRCGPQAEHPVDGQPSVGPGSPLRVSQGVAPRPIPEGYRPAWNDDRLNPHRGPRTAAGDAQMRRVWTDTVPAQLVENPAATRPYTASVSTRSPSATVPVPEAPVRTEASVPGSYVQVGSFGVPDNARGTAERFKAMGLPVATRQMRAGGQTLQVVSIGPLAAQGDLNSALQAARQAGFADAFIRR
ncbi:SPOR domain-containing protein [Alkalilacustris brevis]|uniref:SPOR domain-containing protein n=1 Tax=Alkalilacustris brevis TaxID=2026338 RepID=UPI000E0DC923|nr:SPOR domain-containing protein [Alkalilacustris brevis]